MYKLNMLSAARLTVTYLSTAYRTCTTEKHSLNISQSASRKSCRIYLNIVKAEKHKQKDKTVQFCCKTTDVEVWTDSVSIFSYSLARKITKGLV
jgi:ribosomal protein L18E